MRLKILFLFIFSFGLFFINDFFSLAFFVIAFVVYLFIAFAIDFNFELKKFSKVVFISLKLAIPIYFICIFSFAFNAFVIDQNGIDFSAGGAKNGSIYVIRLCLLGWASLFIANSTSMIDFANAVASICAPLKKIGVDPKAVSIIFSLTMRLIPEIYSEFLAIRDAQWCRGASFDNAGILKKLKANASCILPLIVRMLKRSDDIAFALYIRGWAVEL